MKVIPFNRWKTPYSKIHNAICINSFNNTHSIFFVKNGNIHNSKCPAEISFNKSKDIYYKKYYCLFDIIYGDIMNNSSWKKYAKDIIRQNKLKIFQ